MPAGRSVVEGRTIPVSAGGREAADRAREQSAEADPLSKCYMPGVPRIMYMPFPFHIYQTPEHIAITFEWSQVHRTIHTNGVPGPEGIDFWMGDSRGRWEGDTLVVDVKDLNDQTWFDTTGTFHSDADARRRALHDDGRRHDSIRGDDRGSEGLLEAVEDRDADLPAQGSRSHPRVSVPGGARRSQRRLRARSEDVVSRALGEARRHSCGLGSDERAEVVRPADPSTRERRAGTAGRSDGSPMANRTWPGYYMPDGGGGNYGLGKHEQDFLTPGGRGIIVDPPDGTLPMQPWAKAEVEEPAAPRARV